ncbi:MAG: UPF0280 family protein [Candidatus Omnitrophica bacterium]|nr:UPF0280 family protein [Candidatus Omnitrophota bacterium]
MHQHRFYRNWVKSEDLISFEVKVFETDLSMLCDKPLKNEAEKAVYEYRKQILDYIEANRFFKDSLKPIEADGSAPEIVRDMIDKSAIAGVGPMAGVAGAIAQYTGMDLLDQCSQVLIENGGDIFIKSDTERRLSIYAGDSPLSGKINLKIAPSGVPLGICTSSGTVGHSKSFGKADAATIIARDAVLADCVATQAGNLVKNADDLQAAIDYARSIEGVTGALVIIGSKLASWGEVELL